MSKGADGSQPLTAHRVATRLLLQRCVHQRSQAWKSRHRGDPRAARWPWSCGHHRFGQDGVCLWFGIHQCCGRRFETGAADLDGDGQVSVHELYQYVYDQVRRGTSSQTPTMSADDMRGQLYLAKNPHAPLPLPVKLEQALTSEVAWERLWAVDGLRRLLTSDAPGGQKRTARQTLARLRDADTDLDVQKAASEVLSEVSRRPDATDHHGRLSRWLVGVGLVLTAVVALVVVTVRPWTLITAKPPIACSPSTKPADGVLSFGTLLPKTGELIFTGQAMDAGVHLAMKDINDAGGIPGMEVKLDDANQRDEGDVSADIASKSEDHKAIAYDGPSGPLRFTDHGEPSSATYNIGKIQADGTVKTLRSETVTLAITPTPAQPSAR
jgi:hypothetical protein